MKDKIVFNRYMKVQAALHYEQLLNTQSEVEGTDENREVEGTDEKLIRFSYSDLQIATDYFRHRIRFSQFYKGTLPDGRKVTVKRFWEHANIIYCDELEILGILPHPKIREHALTIYYKELEILPALQHPNIVKLYGFCSKGRERFLVYEYLQNGNLSDALHGNALQLDWETRYKICLGLAKALAYLHEESMRRIIHRHVNPYNVLLDWDLNPKIYDFGETRILSDEDIHVSTLDRGTSGYLDPEYHMTSKLTEKSDVYSFGVTAFEILSGRRESVEKFINAYDSELVKLARNMNENSRGLELVDPSLSTFNKEQAMQMFEVAIMCTQLKGSSRPSMSEVVIMLMRSFVTEPISSGSLEPQTTQTQPISSMFLETQTTQTQPISSGSSILTGHSSIGHGADHPHQLTPEDINGTLSDGREVVVKRIWLLTDNELSLLAALQHPNFVKLYGFCSSGSHSFLVYEYLQNGNLRDALHGNALQLDWETRYKICLGLAKALAYLQEESMPRITHRSVNPSNVLLDWDLNPKICDFGEERWIFHEEICGFIDPEYFRTLKLTEKSDVYSFGVTALEILSGRKAWKKFIKDSDRRLVDLARNMNENSRGLELVDPSLSTFNKEQAMQMFEVAIMCTQLKRSSRPSMSEVVIMLMRSFVAEPISSGSLDTQTTQIQITHRISGSSTLTGHSSMGHGIDLPHQLTTEDMDEIREMNDGLTNFGYDEIRIATEDFNTSNKLGQGGFGPVYKGILTDGRMIAVKKLSVISHKGNKQFLAEIFTISAVQHPNIVKLYGYCIEDENRLLVYEYLVNRSLDQALFGKNALHLDWTARKNICLGIARGLVCSHEESEPRIIHIDVKASNILLDNDLNPKISDFGLAMLFDGTKTHVSTIFGGTVGYIAPEYAMRGRLTEKADVYAFGVVTLEIICGRPVNDSSLGPGKTYLLELVWNLYENGRSLELMDPTLESFDEVEASRLLNVALLCTQVSPKMRPTMSLVVSMITGASEVTVAEKPGYLCD